MEVGLVRVVGEQRDRAGRAGPSRGRDHRRVVRGDGVECSVRVRARLDGGRDRATRPRLEPVRPVRAECERSCLSPCSVTRRQARSREQSSAALTIGLWAITASMAGAAPKPRGRIELDRVLRRGLRAELAARLPHQQGPQKPEDWVGVRVARLDTAQAIEDVVDGEVPHPQWLCPVDLRLAVEQPIRQKRHIHRIRRNEHRASDLASARHHEATSVTGYPFRDIRDGQQRAAAVGCHNRQQAALGITPEPIQEVVRLLAVAEPRAPRQDRGARGTPSPPLRSPTAPLSRADRARQATPTDPVPRRDVVAPRSGDRRRRCLEKARRDSFGQGRSRAGRPWRSDRSGRVAHRRGARWVSQARERGPCLKRHPRDVVEQAERS